MANTTNAPLNLPPDPQETRRQVRLAWGLVVMGVACALLGGLIYGGSLILDWIDDRVFTDAPESAVVVDTGELVIAVSPAMKPTFDQLVGTFNAGAAEPDLPVLQVRLSDFEPEVALDAASVLRVGPGPTGIVGDILRRVLLIEVHNPVLVPTHGARD